MKLLWAWKRRSLGRELIHSIDGHPMLFRAPKYAKAVTYYVSLEITWTACAGTEQQEIRFEIATFREAH
jgi:hypothetical protein